MISAIAPDQLARLHAEHVDEIQRRYARVLEAAELDAVILHSGSLKLRSHFDDQYWPLRVVPHFQHWLPLEHPDCALVVRPGRRPRLVWLRETSYWENLALPESDHWRAALEVIEVGRLDDARDHLPDGRIAFIGDGHAAVVWGIPAEATNPQPLVTALDRERTLKTPYEIACLAEANRRAALGHRRVAEIFRGGEARSELEMHLAYLAATGLDDAETPYKNIVATGANAATLHHVTYRRQPRREAGGSLLVDAGATCLGYASDITRTYVRGTGAAETTFAQLLAGMERLQQGLCARVREGLPYEELHEEAHRHVAALLREVGLVHDLGVEEMDEGGVTRAFFPHGLGHSLGLQTHDVGCAQIKPKPRNPHLRNTSTIARGQVFTIEPGLYFIPGLMEQLRASPHAGAVDWRLVEELSRLGGIRIEDDLLVESGTATRNLTREVLPAS